MTVAREIAKYASGLSFDALPNEVVHEAKRAVLDALGCAIGAYPGEACRIIRDLVQDLGGPRESTIIGSGLKTSCLNAILANGVMLRYLDFNDTYAIHLGIHMTGGHPGEVIPAALALGEREHSKGLDVITAIVIGYELSARLMHSLVSPSATAPTIEAKGWNGDTRGIFVMPVVAGKLLGLNEEQMEHAIGISGSHNMILGIVDTHGESYSMTKSLRFPRTAYGGTMAALMAKKGFTGPTRVIEGNKGFVHTVMGGDFNAEKLTEPTKKFKILDTIYKSVAADAGTHGHLTAALQLVKKHDIRPEDVAEVKITAPSRCVEHTGDPVKRFPTTKESADHSSYYLTAIAIIDRKVGPDQFTPKKLSDPRIREMIDKISMEADPSLDHVGRGGITEIRTKQGNVFRQRVEYPKGDPLNPMTDEELEDKFREMAEKFMTKRQIEKTIATIHDMEKLDDTNKLMRTVVFKGQARRYDNASPSS
jgi:2-methylcitrate dehydratase